MAVTLIESVEKKLLEVHASALFTEEDYKQLGNATERLLTKTESIRVLLILEDFHGWEMDSFWERGKMAAKYKRRVHRMATVGSESSQDLLATMAHSWTHTEVRFFPTDQLEQARAWIEEA